MMANSNKKYNNKYNNKGRGKTDEPREGRAKPADEFRDSKVNDISHHARDPQLLSDAASFAYSNALGTTFTWSDDPTDVDSVPGVCALVTHPMIGHATSWNDAINIAARSLYSWVRHANSGHANYEAADLAMYIYGLANLDSLIEWAKRLYGIMGNTSFKNRYIPKALVEANGVSYESMADNLANFRYRLNMAIRKRNSFAVPKNMALYQRARWMYSGLYMDANTPKGQIYMFVPDGWYVLNVGGGTDVTHLVYAKISGDYGELPSNLLTWQDVADLVDQFIDAIWRVEDFNIMSGDILKCYGEGGVETVLEIADSFITNIGYEFEVLSEIQNATVLHCNVTNDFITQNTDIGKGEIITNPQLVFRDASVMDDLVKRRMVTVPFPNPTPADNMIATRLTVIPTTGAIADRGYFDADHTTGSEIVVGMRICDIVKDSETSQWTTDWYSGLGYASHPDIEQPYFGSFMSHFGDMSKFDYHPFVSARLHSGDSELQEQPMRMFDVDNYTIMTAADLKKMHDLSIWTQFDWGA